MILYHLTSDSTFVAVQLTQKQSSYLCLLWKRWKMAGKNELALMCQFLNHKFKWSSSTFYYNLFLKARTSIQKFKIWNTAPSLLSKCWAPLLIIHLRLLEKHWKGHRSIRRYYRMSLATALVASWWAFLLLPALPARERSLFYQNKRFQHPFQLGVGNCWYVDYRK